METPYPLVPDTRNELEPRDGAVLRGSRTTLFWEFADEVEKQMAPGGEYESIRPFAAKLPEHAARLGATIAAYRDLNFTELSREDFFCAAFRSPSTTRPKRNGSPGSRLDRLPDRSSRPQEAARLAPARLDQAHRQRARYLHLRAQLHPRSRDHLEPGRNSRQARLAHPHQDASARHARSGRSFGSQPMSMRDFITRHSNTAPRGRCIAPPIVMETTSAIVDWRPHLAIVEENRRLDPSRARPARERRPVLLGHREPQRRRAGKGKTERRRSRLRRASVDRSAVCQLRPRQRPDRDLGPGTADPRGRCSRPLQTRTVLGSRTTRRSSGRSSKCILIPQHGWPMVPVDRHVCTMSLALAHAYPGSLEGVAEILGLVNQKDIAREKIVRVMWKPRKPRRGEDPTQTLLGRFAGTASAICISTTGRTSRSNASCINIQSCRRCRRRSKIRGCSTLRSTITACCIDAPLATAASRLAAQALADLE